MQSSLKQNALGQSLSEYVVIGALVSVVAVVPCMALSGGFDSLLKTIQSDAARQSNASKAIAEAPVAVVAKPGALQGASAASATLTDDAQTAGTGALTVDSASFQNASAFSNTTANMVETAGANGATELMALQIETTAKKLYNDGQGSISEQQYKSLMDLANQGHRMAEISRLIESAGNANMSGEAFMASSVTFEGKTTTVKQLYNTIGTSLPQGSLQGDPMHPQNMEQMYPELKSFINLYQKAEADGSLNSPEAQSIVHEAASRIAQINVSLDNTYDAVKAGSVNPTQISKSASSDLTNRNASTVCDVGNGSDSGIKCS